MKEIGQLRRRIDAIDDQILELINQRLVTAGQIGGVKKRLGTAVVDSRRESRIYQRLSSSNKGPLKDAALHRIFRAVIAAGREVQGPQNYAGGAPLYAVIGNPIGHSLSPVMHNSALAHEGLGGSYLAFKVENIAAAVEGIRGLGIRGASITIPHKVTVMAYLDEVDSLAAEIGAVNTIINQDGVLRGYNSDCDGAVKSLSEQAVIRGRDVALIGAGGAARALGFGLMRAGGNLTIINRTRTTGEKLARDLGCRYIPLSELNDLPYHVVVNATPVGMTPDVDRTPVPSRLLVPETVVMDMVYNPLQTRFLKEAKKIGCTVIDGVSMLVHQGAVQFELWTSQPAPVDVMRKVVLEALASK